MSRTRPADEKGFTLIELLVVIAIIMILLSLIVVNFGGILNKTKQIGTQDTIRNVGNGCMRWVNSLGGSASVQDPVDANNYPQVLTRDEVAALLSPSFLPYVPEKDQWGNSFEYRFSGNLNGPAVFCIRSPGADGIFDSDQYNIGPFISTEFGRDIVWADGTFVRWPSDVEARP